MTIDKKHYVRTFNLPDDEQKNQSGRPPQLRNKETDRLSADELAARFAKFQQSPGVIKKNGPEVIDTKQWARDYAAYF